LRRLHAVGGGHVASIRWDLIYGLPGDTLADVLLGLDFVSDASPGATVALQPLQVLPGTQYREDAVAHGLIYDEEAPYVAVQSRTFSSSDMHAAEVIAGVVASWREALRCICGPRVGLTLPGLYSAVITTDFLGKIRVADRPRREGTLEFGISLLALIDRATGAPHVKSRARDVVEWTLIDFVGSKIPVASATRLRSHRARPARSASRGAAAGSYSVSSEIDDALIFAFEYDLTGRIASDGPLPTDPEETWRLAFGSDLVTMSGAMWMVLSVLLATPASSDEIVRKLQASGRCGAQASEEIVAQALCVLQEQGVVRRSP
jgi:hypothetical protein